MGCAPTKGGDWLDAGELVATLTVHDAHPDELEPMRRPPTTDARATHAAPSLADNALMLLKLAFGIARTLGIGRS